jgi:hypothetical protein
MTRSRTLSSRFVDWAFRSRESGDIVLGQRPNFTAATTAVAAILAVATRREGTRATAAQIVVLAALVWALQELFAGVNPFRRLQGMLTLGGLSLLARD